MSNEIAEYRVERNRKLEERAKREAWQEAAALAGRQRDLSDRMARAEQEYGRAALGRRQRPPVKPNKGCDRSEIERYAKELRKYCAAAEAQLDRAKAATERAIAQAWDEARALRRRREALQTRIGEVLRGQGLHEAAFEDPPGEPPKDCQRSVIETHVEELRKHCAVTEKQVSRIERDQRREETAWRWARERARNLEDRLSQVRARVEEAEGRYGREALAPLVVPPNRPTEPCERTVFEEYVRNLRTYCEAAEEQVAGDEAVAKRRRNDAWAQATALGQRWDSLQELSQKTGASTRQGDRHPPQQPEASCSVAEIEAYVKKMQAHCNEVEGRIQRANVEATWRGIEGAMHGAFGSESTSLEDMRQHAVETGEVGATRQKARADREDAARQEARRVLEDLPSAVSQDERASLARIADEIVEARIDEDERAEELMEELQSGVRAAKDRVERRHDAEHAAGLLHGLREIDGDEAAGVARELVAVAAGSGSLTPELATHAWSMVNRHESDVDAAAEEAMRDAERVAALKEKLRGLDGDDVAAVVTAIAAVERGENVLSPEMMQRAGTVCDEARRRADRAYVAEVMRDEIEKLGYRAEERFESLLVRDGRALVRKGDGADYGVEIELLTYDRVHMEPVRIGAASAIEPAERQRRDREAEDACCGALEEVRRGMRNRGIETTPLLTGSERRAEAGQSLREIDDAPAASMRDNPLATPDRRPRQAPAQRGRSRS